MITILPMRSQNQSYLVLVLVIFPAFEKVTGDCQEFWLVCHTVCSCCDWSECLFGSGFSTVSKWVSECNNRALNRNSADFRSDVPRSLKLPMGRHFSPFLLSSRGPDWYLIFSSHYMRSASGNLTVTRQDVLTQGTYEIAFSRGVLHRCVFSELPVFSIFFYLCLVSVSGVLVPGVDVYGTLERLSMTFTANGKRQTVGSCVS